MKVWVLFILFLVSGKVFAQQISGQVLDYHSKLPMGNVTVIYGKLITVTNGTGRFSFQKSISKDTLIFQKPGYSDYLLTPDNNFNNLTIYLKSLAISLDEVVILSKRNYLADSLKLRKDYASVFDYKAPGIKDVLVKKGLSRPQFGSNLVSNSTSSIVSLDVLTMIGLFGKHKSPVSKLQKVQLKAEEDNYISHRFDVQKLKAVTGLENDSLKNFIQKYRPTATEIRKMNDYQLLMYIKKSYNEFINENKAKP